MTPTFSCINGPLNRMQRLSNCIVIGCGLFVFHVIINKEYHHKSPRRSVVAEINNRKLGRLTEAQPQDTFPKRLRLGFHIFPGPPVTGKPDRI